MEDENEARRNALVAALQKRLQPGLPLFDWYGKGGRSVKTISTASGDALKILHSS
jgi:hypothetical protein